MQGRREGETPPGDFFMKRGFVTFLLVCALTAAVGAFFLRQRELRERTGSLQQNREAIEEVRREVHDLGLRLEQTRERVKRLETDPVEAEAAVRGIRRFMRDDEKVFRVEEEAPPPEPPPAPGESPPETPQVPGE